MEYPAIALARFIAFVEIIELDPRGQLYYPDLFAALVEHYGFQKFPQKYEEFDLQKGITLASGQWEKGGIDKVEIYAGGISVDTRSSTAESEQLLHECLTWVNEKFGFKYRKEMIKRKAYVSQIIFNSNAPILSALSSPLSRLAEQVSDALSNILKEKIVYEPNNFWLQHDATTRQLSLAAFTIQRRLGVPFAENKYFSEAPLPTDIHLKFLEDFEADIIR